MPSGTLSAASASGCAILPSCTAIGSRYWSSPTKSVTVYSCATEEVSRISSCCTSPCCTSCAPEASPSLCAATSTVLAEVSPVASKTPVWNATKSVTKTRTNPTSLRSVFLLTTAAFFFPLLERSPCSNEYFIPFPTFLIAHAQLCCSILTNSSSLCVHENVCCQRFLQCYLRNHLRSRYQCIPDNQCMF